MIFSYLDFEFIDLYGETAGIEDSSAALEFQSGTPLCVNLLPSHPFDYPFFEAIEDLLARKPGLLSDMLSRYQVPSILFLFPCKSSLWQTLQSVETEIFSFRRVKPFYPFELAEIRGIEAVQDTLVIGWFEFYTLLLNSAGEKLPGIPVSITHLGKGKRTACTVPGGITLEKLLAETGFDNVSENTVCFDHPFTGTALTKDAAVTEIRPHSIIIAENDRVKRASLFQIIRRMASQKNDFSRDPLYDSSPTAVSFPCQKCLRCVRVCPDKIVPFVISALYRNEDIKEAKKFLPELCRECGLCTYVCPSRIPLLHNIRGLKKETGAL